MSKRRLLLCRRRHGVLRSPAADAETGDDNISKCRRQVGGGVRWGCTTVIWANDRTSGNGGVLVGDLKHVG